MKLVPPSALHNLAESIPAQNRGTARARAYFEVVEDYRSDAYRAVYSVKFEGDIYVLHAFQKKSPSGIRTARKDIELIGKRLKEARADYEVRFGEGKE
jgi:phage-related protein